MAENAVVVVGLQIVEPYLLATVVVGRLLRCAAFVALHWFPLEHSSAAQQGVELPLAVRLLVVLPYAAILVASEVPSSVR